MSFSLKGGRIIKHPSLTIPTVELLLTGLDMLSVLSVEKFSNFTLRDKRTLFVYEVKYSYENLFWGIAILFKRNFYVVYTSFG